MIAVPADHPHRGIGAFYTWAALLMWAGTETVGLWGLVVACVFVAIVGRGVGWSFSEEAES